jgi:hypothetical protein
LHSTPGAYARYWTEQQAKLRARMGDAAFDAAYAKGAALTLAEAVKAALDVDHPDLAAGSRRFGDAVAEVPQPPRQVPVAEADAHSTWPGI